MTPQPDEIHRQYMNAIDRLDHLPAELLAELQQARTRAEKAETDLGLLSDDYGNLLKQLNAAEARYAHLVEQIRKLPRQTFTCDCDYAEGVVRNSNTGDGLEDSDEFIAAVDLETLITESR